MIYALCAWLVTFVLHVMYVCTATGTVWDWYSTFAALGQAGDPTDSKAAAAGLPPIDSVDLSSTLGLVPGHSPTPPNQTRVEIPIGTEALNVSGIGVLLVQGLIQGNWKLLLGEMAMAGWQGAFTYCTKCMV